MQAGKSCRLNPERWTGIISMERSFCEEVEGCLVSNLNGSATRENAPFLPVNIPEIVPTANIDSYVNAVYDVIEVTFFSAPNRLTRRRKMVQVMPTLCPSGFGVQGRQAVDDGPLSRDEGIAVQGQEKAEEGRVK
jgi:hypothetical protein